MSAPVNKPSNGYIERVNKVNDPNNNTDSLTLLLRSAAQNDSFRKELFSLATKLYDSGFNVIPVLGKRPLGSWSSDKRLDKEILRRKLKVATGIAIAGGKINPFQGEGKILMLVDIDNPRAPSQFLKELLSKTVLWETGPRCLKCSNKIRKEEVLEFGRRFKCSECGDEFEVEDAIRGMGALFLVDSQDLLDLLGEEKTVRTNDIELLVKNYQLIPPSFHVSGVQYSWLRPFNWKDLYFGIYTLSRDELKALLDELNYKKLSKSSSAAVSLPPTNANTSGRVLAADEVLKIVEVLKPVYHPGHRDFIVFHLSGWLKKAGVSFESAKQVIELLARDDEELKSRLYVLQRTYEKDGEISGKSGLFDTLREVTGEAKALEIMRQIEEILQVSSPYQDPLFEILDYSKKLFAVANVKRKILVTAFAKEDGMQYKDAVAVVCPTQVIKYQDPFSGIEKYEVTFDGETLTRPITVYGSLDDIIARLKIGGYVKRERLIRDVLTAVIHAYLRKGRGEIRAEVEAPGFYLVDNKIQAIKFEIKNVTQGELREALEFLNELATKWYRHEQDKFSEAIKWGIIAPFSFVFKQKDRWIPWLFLYGASHTGKTTLARVVLSLWGLDLGRYEKAGSSIDTIPRLGFVLSQSTFPVLINEPGNALSREDVVETIKAAVERIVARGRYSRGTYEEIPALAPLILTSNKYLPKDDALARRFKILKFTYGEKIDSKKAEEFEKTVLPRLKILERIGHTVAKLVIESGSLNWDDWESEAEHLLRKCYELAGLDSPPWLSLRVESSVDITEEYIEAIRTFLIDKINDTFSKRISKLIIEKIEEDNPWGGKREEYLNTANSELKERARAVLSQNLLPWAFLKDDVVYFTSGFARELEKVIGDIGGLKSIAELLKWGYKQRHSFRTSQKVKTMSVMYVPFAEFIEFLTPYSFDEEDEGAD